MINTMLRYFSTEYRSRQDAEIEIAALRTRLANKAKAQLHFTRLTPFMYCESKESLLEGLKDAIGLVQSMQGVAQTISFNTGEHGVLDVTFNQTTGEVNYKFLNDLEENDVAN